MLNLTLSPMPYVLTLAWAHLVRKGELLRLPEGSCTLLAALVLGDATFYWRVRKTWSNASWTFGATDDGYWRLINSKQAGPQPDRLDDVAPRCSLPIRYGIRDYGG